MTLKLTRQKIYDRIKTSSKDSYVLEEMKRLGFWDKEKPTLSESLIKREAEINKELTELQKLDKRFKNQEALLAEMRKERMKKAKEKRLQTKEANKQKQLEKTANWKLLQENQIRHLGKDVSYGLGNTDSNIESLKEYNLPVYKDIVHLAQSMEISLSEMRYLLYHRRVSKSTHYHTFSIPKKSGGTRTISAPKSKLKRLQYWVLNNILDAIPAGEYAHGFIAGKSILTNAQPHIGKDIVINIDLQNFFPTITFKRIKGLFSKLGYSEQLATIFALICTETPCDKVQMDGVDYYVQNSERVLPQGSPASPAISNLIAWRLDRKIQGLASKYGFTYTRYADDLTFSASAKEEKNIAGLLYFIEKIIRSEGLTINTEKTSIMRKSRQQRVTGVVINEKLNIPRDEYRRFRALLHNIEANGWKDQHWRHSKNLPLSVKGYISFVRMINPDKGQKFEEQLKRIVDKHGFPEIEKKDTFPTRKEPQNQSIEQEPPIIQEEKLNKEDRQTDDTNWWNIL